MPPVEAPREPEKLWEGPKDPPRPPEDPPRPPKDCPRPKTDSKWTQYEPKMDPK